MKYKQGRKLTGVEAIKILANGGVVLEVGYPHRVVDRGVQAFGVMDESWMSNSLSLTDAYEAIPVPEYNLTFMEAWEEMKKGKIVEREGCSDRCRYDGARLTASGSWAYASSAWIDGKYRVVDPA